MSNRLELRVYGSAAGDNLRVSFENLLAITIHHTEIYQEAINLGGNIVDKSLVLFTSSENLLKLVTFIANL